MIIQGKIHLIAEALDVVAGALKPEIELASLEEWDSMGTISVLAMLDKRFNRQLTVEEISALIKIQDVLDLMLEE